MNCYFIFEKGPGFTKKKKKWKACATIPVVGVFSYGCSFCIWQVDSWMIFGKNFIVLLGQF